MCIGDGLTLVHSVSLMGHAAGAKRSVNYEDALGRREPWSSNDQPLAASLAVAHVHRDPDAVIMPFRADGRLSSGYSSVASIPDALFASLNSRRLVKALGDERVLRTPRIELLPDPRAASYDDLARRLGSPFIVKGDRSVSGSECFVVRIASDLDEARRRCGRRLNTAWEYVRGRSLNFHFVCCQAGIAVLPPSTQILTAGSALRPFQFAGSDYTTSEADDIVAQGHQEVARAATALQHCGYRGVGGLDLVVGRDGLTFGVDLNPRLQGSTLPLSAALSASLGFGIGQLQVGSCEGSGADLLHTLAELPLQVRDWGGQLLVRNETSRGVAAPAVLPDGVYSRTDGEWVWRGSYEFPRTLDTGELVVLDSARPEVIIRPTGLMCRVLFGPRGRELAALFASAITRRLEAGADALMLDPSI